MNQYVASGVAVGIDGAQADVALQSVVEGAGSGEKADSVGAGIVGFGLDGDVADGPGLQASTDIDGLGWVAG